MKKVSIGISLLALLAVAALSFAQAAKEKPYISSGTQTLHRVFTPGTLKWEQLSGAAPGVMVAVLDGEPHKPGSRLYHPHQTARGD
jgi:hypothetical protein